MQEKELLKKILDHCQTIMFKIVWHNGTKPEPVLSVCKTKSQCKQIIKRRAKVWEECTGYDIRPELEIISFKYINEIKN